MEADHNRKQDTEEKLILEEEKHQEVDEARYTTMFWNQKPSTMAAIGVIGTIFILVGMSQGYLNALILELQEKGATYSDQALFSLTLYPYLFKIVFAPFIDSYFFTSVGKCKTYIVGSCVVQAVCFGILAPSSHELITPKGIPTLVLIWVLINCVVVFLQISGEMWIIKIFEGGDHKSRGSLLLEVGMPIGMFITYNIFVPLNSAGWLSHGTMLYFMMLSVLAYAAWILLFVAEKSIETEDANKRPTLLTLIKVIPKFFIHDNMRKLLLFVAATRVLRFMFAETILLAYINNGLSKSAIVNIDTLTFPVLLGSSFIVAKYMKQGSLAFFYTALIIYGQVLTLLNYLILTDMRSNHSLGRTKVFLFILNFLDKLVIPTTFLVGYVNTVTPEEIGSTFITFLMCWFNICANMPNSLGLKLVHWMPGLFDVLVLGAISIQMVLCFSLFGFAKKLDTYTKTEFDILKEDAPPANVEVQQPIRELKELDKN
jgi:MFS transporter, PAT family, solute carrier family 33 (acetyl-CoA transportor), member 1